MLIEMYPVEEFVRWVLQVDECFVLSCSGKAEAHQVGRREQVYPLDMRIVVSYMLIRSPLRELTSWGLVKSLVFALYPTSWDPR